MPTDTKTPAEWVTIQEAADYLQVSTKTVRNYITRGTIPAKRIGPRIIRIHRPDLDNLGLSLQYIEGE